MIKLNEWEIIGQLPRDFEKRQNEIPNKNIIGFKGELLKFPKYQKLSEINNHRNQNENREIDFYRKTSVVLGRLNLSIKLRTSILKNAENFYSVLGYRTNHRGTKVLIPVSVYIACLERFIFVKRNAFYQFCTKHNFDRCLRAILVKNNPLRLKFLSKDFRIKTITVQLSGLQNHFYLNGLFFQKAFENLSKYYDIVKNGINAGITGVIFDLTAHQLIGKFVMKSEVCRFLGISEALLFRRRLY